MGITVEDINFELALRQKRDAEQFKELKELLTPKEILPDGVKESIEAQTLVLKGFTDVINETVAAGAELKQLIKEKDLSVKVETNQEKVVTKLEDMCKLILDGQKALLKQMEQLNKPKKYSHVFITNSVTGLIESSITNQL
jgi:hypothetical protein